MRIEIQYVR